MSILWRASILPVSSCVRRQRARTCGANDLAPDDRRSCLSRCGTALAVSFAPGPRAARGMFSQKFLIPAITRVYGIYLNEFTDRQPVCPMGQDVSRTPPSSDSRPLPSCGLGYSRAHPKAEPSHELVDPRGHPLSGPVGSFVANSISPSRRDVIAALPDPAWGTCNRFRGWKPASAACHAHAQHCENAP